MKQFKQFFLSALALLAILFASTSCMDDLSNDIVVQPDGAKQIPYTVTVQRATATKVTVDGTDQQTLLFETGDQLFIVGTDISGTLTLVTGGEGLSSAYFSGILTYTGSGDPDPDLELTATLRSAGQPWPVDYSSAVAPTLAEAVRDYSVMTGTSTYGAMNFSLSQKSAFIVFDITIVPAPNDGNQTVTIYNNQGVDNLASGTVTVSGGKASFAVAFDGSSTTLLKPSLSIHGYTIKFGGTSSVALVAGSKYTVDKTTYNDRMTPLTIEATENNTTVTFSNPMKLLIRRIVHGNNPSDPDLTINDTFTVELDANERVEFFGANEAYSGLGGFTIISCDKDSYVYGNVMSLVQRQVTSYMTDPSKYADLDALIGPGTFAGLLHNEHIINHPVRNVELPAIGLTVACYYGMFADSGISRTPNLPATTGLAEECYEHMFENCHNLVTVPENLLPSTVLKESCYSHMFNGCVNLKNAPVLPAMELQTACYASMFKECAQLEKAPVLPATTLVPSCYEGMFAHCTNLNYIKCLATDIPSSSCTDYWTNDVAATGTFVRDENMTGWTRGDNGIPYNWLVLPGEFSVSATKKVAFASGNLYVENGTYGFDDFDHYVRHPNGEDWTSIPTTRNLFAWNELGVLLDGSDFDGQSSDYTITGNLNLEGHNWRMLTMDEWLYLLGASEGHSTAKSRSNAHALRGPCTIGGIFGLLIAPDGYTESLPTTATTIPDGCVFLPAAGAKTETSMESVMMVGRYGVYNSASTERAGYSGCYVTMFNYGVDEYSDVFYVNPDQSLWKAESYMSVRLARDLD